MGVFRTAEGRYIELGVFSEDHLWDLLCAALGLTEHSGLDMTQRAADAVGLRAAVSARIEQWNRDEIVELLTLRGVPVAPVLTRDEMLEHPNFHERGVIVTGPDGYRCVGHPITYLVHPSLTPGRPPALDEH
jgi:crotonobetainyl-CoA:carnitine CoA-transferase CaiB-like acyl-CoA transferase